MASLKKLLVVNDTLTGMPEALSKAALIEHYTGAEVEIAEVIWDTIEEEPLNEPDKANLIEAFTAAERHGLNRLLEPYSDRIAWSEARVLWNKRTDDAIVEEIKSQDVSLVIKPGARYGLIDHLHAPLDWRIIREAPCPVLISQSDAWATGGAVLAAVDIADTAHQELNDKILQVAQTIAQTLAADLHVCCVYSDLGQSVNALQVAMDYEGIKEDMRLARETALAETLARLEMQDSTITHIEEGKPATVIAHRAEALGATVTVMGTAARSGIGKLVLGNTAEDTLTHLQGDVLTVRN